MTHWPSSCCSAAGSPLVSVPDNGRAESKDAAGAACDRQPATMRRAPNRNTPAASILVGRSLIAELLSIAEGVGAERVSERRRPVDRGVDDVVGRQVGRRQAAGLTHALGDLVVGARRIAAHAKAADAGLPLVEAEAAAKGDRTATDLADAGRQVYRIAATQGVERVAVGGAPQRVTRLAERVEARRGHRSRIAAEAIC